MDDISKYIEDHKTLANPDAFVTNDDIDSYINDHRESSTLSDIKQLGKDVALNLTHGATFNNLPFFAGAAASGLDLAQSGLHNVGLAKESPSQLGERLKEQGFTGDIGPTSEADVYDLANKDIRNQVDAAYERHPVLSTMTQIAGSIPTGGALAKGLGLGARALGTTKLAQAAPEAVKDLASYLSSSKNIIPKIARSVAIGAPEGAIIGAGNSEGKLINSTPEERSQLFSDILHGGATGSLIGTGIALTPKILSGIKGIGAASKKGANSLAKDIDYLKQVELSAKTGAKSQDFFGNAAREHIQGDTENAVVKTVGGLSKGVKTAGQELEQSLKNSKAIFNQATSPEAGQALDQVLGDVGQSPGYIKGGQSKDIINLIQKFKTNSLSAEELYTLRDILKDNLSTQNEVLGNNLRNASDALREELFTIPEFKAANTKFHDFEQAGMETLLNKGAPSRAAQKAAGIAPNEIVNLRKYYQSDKSTPFNDAYTSLKGATERFGRPGTSADSSKQLFKSFENELGIFDQKYPGEVKRLTGMSIDDLTSQLQEQGHLEAIRRAIVSERAEGKPIEAILGLLSPKALSFKAANWAGYLATAPPKALYNSGPRQLNELAQKLLATPSATHYGQALQEAVQKNDIFKQNALIFSLQQNPSTRKLLGNAEEGEQ